MIKTNTVHFPTRKRHEYPSLSIMHLFPDTMNNVITQYSPDVVWFKHLIKHVPSLIYKQTLRPLCYYTRYITLRCQLLFVHYIGLFCKINPFSCGRLKCIVAESFIGSFSYLRSIWNTIFHLENYFLYFKSWEHFLKRCLFEFCLSYLMT